MKNFKEMVYGNLFEAKGFKPDFLDLDKDGNKTECCHLPARSTQHALKQAL